MPRRTIELDEKMIEWFMDAPLDDRAQMICKTRARYDTVPVDLSHREAAKPKRGPGRPAGSRNRQRGGEPKQ